MATTKKIEALPFFLSFLSFVYLSPLLESENQKQNTVFLCFTPTRSNLKKNTVDSNLEMFQEEKY